LQLKIDENAFATGIVPSLLGKQSTSPISTRPLRFRRLNFQRLWRIDSGVSTPARCPAVEYTM